LIAYLQLAEGIGEITGDRIGTPARDDINRLGFGQFCNRAFQRRVVEIAQHRIQRLARRCNKPFQYAAVLAALATAAQRIQALVIRTAVPCAAARETPIAGW
jgi:hypothetical protein